MATKVKNTTFNENIDERIARLEYLISLGLQADNMSTIESRYVTYLGDTITEFKMQNLSTINNIDMQDLNSSVNFLSETNIEKKSQSFELGVITDPGSNNNNSARETHENIIDIPLGWDGRNSFVFYHLMGVIEEAGADNKYVNLDKRMIVQFKKDQWFNMTKNRTSIMFNTFLKRNLSVRYSYISGGDNHWDNFEKVVLKGYVLMWRNR